jgi:hypothetical protein
MVEATIEDLAITSRSSRESDEVRRRGDGAENLHGSETISKSPHLASWYHGNKDDFFLT